MANLVAPVNILQPIEERIIEFKGLNKRTMIEDGEMPDMKNLTADAYPVLMPRKPRGQMEVPDGVMRPLQIIRRFDKIGFIAIDTYDPEEEDPEMTVSFYYDGEKVDDVTGLNLETRAVAINNRMCFFPQKTAIDITIDGVQPGTYRSLEATFEVPAGGTTITINGLTSVYMDVEKGLFDYDDAINIEGTLAYTPSGGSATSMPVNVSCIIEDIEKGNPTDRIYLPVNTFIELVGQGATGVKLSQSGTISRTMPDLDYVVEWNNRLWGCANSDNTIYACKLGDPFNWQYFQGTGLDSYYAQQGTDEKFSGIAEYSGHLIFFKPNSMTRVYGTSPSNYQVTNTKAYGVEYGSSASILTINDTVYYKSSIGIMAYQGGAPFLISDKFRNVFKNVVAGTEGTKYYASCLVKEGESYRGRLFVFDIAKGLWHVEDDKRFTSTCKIENKVYYTAASADILVCDTDVFCSPDLLVSTDYVAGEIGIINPDVPTEASENIDWMAQFGPFDEYIEEHKIYSKLALRIKANGEASARVYINLDEQKDSEGHIVWEQVEYYPHISTKGDFIPIVPRRCDRYSIKVVGKGDCEIKSLTRRVRRGSFGRL